MKRHSGVGYQRTGRKSPGIRCLPTCRSPNGVRELERRVRDLEMENAFLKKAGVPRTMEVARCDMWLKSVLHGR
jgi:hypothetical protein